MKKRLHLTYIYTTCVRTSEQVEEKRKGSSRTWHRLVRSSKVYGFRIFMKNVASAKLCLNPTGQRYARGALVTSFRVGWLSGNCRRLRYGEHSSNTICDLPTFKQRDGTRHVHYDMLYMWRIYCFHLNQGNFAKFFMAVSFTLVDLKFLVQQF